MLYLCDECMSNLDNSGSIGARQKMMRVLTMKNLIYLVIYLVIWLFTKNILISILLLLYAFVIGLLSIKLLILHTKNESTIDSKLYFKTISSIITLNSLLLFFNYLMNNKSYQFISEYSILWVVNMMISLIVVVFIVSILSFSYFIYLFHKSGIFRSRVLGKGGVSDLLVTLLENPSITLSELGKLSGIQLDRISFLLTRMELVGLVIHEQDTDKIFKLTDLGRDEAGYLFE